jgi:thiol-disulfide isomerase/thioredoxin
VSTVLALLAAAGTVVLLSDGADDDPAADTPSSVITLEPIEDVATFDEAAYATWTGDEVPLSGVRGAPTVVNFFASTCVPCVTEMPAFEAVYQQLGADASPVQFLGIAVSTDRTEDARDLVETTGVTYDTGKDVDNSVASALDVALLPTTVLLDADGGVAGSYAGELSADELRSALVDDLGIET